MKIITDPVRVTMIARTRLEMGRLIEMLDERELEWAHKDAEGDPLLSTCLNPVLHVEGTDGALLAEFAGRGCYNSFGGDGGGGMGRDTNRDHVKHLIASGHGAVLEHVSFTFAIWNNSRGLTHELVRHRVGTAFSQASTRFRDESGGAFVVPPLVRRLFKDGASAVNNAAAATLGAWNIYSLVTKSVEAYADAYDDMLSTLKTAKLLPSFGFKGTKARKAARGIARSLLPIGLESPITLTVNVRAARNILDQRAKPEAEAEIREMAVAMWRILVVEEPSLFDDYQLETLSDGTEALTTAHTKV